MNVTKLSDEQLQMAIQEKLVDFYEVELIDRLRRITYRGIPSSIMVLSFPIRNGNCYPTSILLSKGMKNFKIVHGNVNEYPLNTKFPNHSWVEKDAYVYDPTDGIKWNKELYYELQCAEAVDVYDDTTIKDCRVYKDVEQMLCYDNDDVNAGTLSLLLQYVESLEIGDNTVNHAMLLEEIKKCRNFYGADFVYPDRAMQKYKEFVREQLKR